MHPAPVPQVKNRLRILQRRPRQDRAMDAVNTSESGQSHDNEGLRTAIVTLVVGVVVLSLFASQPLVGLIGPSLGLEPKASGLITTVTLLGYASGLFLFTPLTDLLENKSLILWTLSANALALGCAAAAPAAPLFFAAVFIAGASTSVIQMLIPAALLLTPEAHRGHIVGTVMSGLMIGILLSRPSASLMAEIAGWRWFYAAQAILVLVLTAVIARTIPRRHPPQTTSYPRLIASMVTILLEEPILRHRALYQALCMGTFGIFWTAIALRLALPPFHLKQSGIALFALAGAAGAVIAPIAGRAGDRGQTQAATALAHMGVIIAMALAAIAGTDWSAEDGTLSARFSLTLMVLAAVILDLGVIADQTLGRRAINLLRPEARGRLNGLFTGIFFLGAATGSGLSGVAWVQGGWSAVCLIGALFAMTALGLFVLKVRKTRKAHEGTSHCPHSVNGV